MYYEWCAPLSLLRGSGQPKSGCKLEVSQWDLTLSAPNLTSRKRGGRFGRGCGVGQAVASVGFLVLTVNQ
jgi:hypothetical protein